MLLCSIVSPTIGHTSNPITNDSTLLESKLIQAEQLNHENPNQSLGLALEVLNSTNISQYPNLSGQARFLVCKTPPAILPSQESIQYCQSAKDFFQARSVEMGIINNNLGIHYDVAGQKDSSEFYFKVAETIFQSLKVPEKLGEV